MPARLFVFVSFVAVFPFVPLCRFPFPPLSLFSFVRSVSAPCLLIPAAAPEGPRASRTQGRSPRQQKPPQIATATKGTPRRKRPQLHKTPPKTDGKKSKTDPKKDGKRAGPTPKRGEKHPHPPKFWRADGIEPLRNAGRILQKTFWSVENSTRETCAKRVILEGQ